MRVAVAAAVAACLSLVGRWRREAGSGPRRSLARSAAAATASALAGLALWLGAVELDRRELARRVGAPAAGAPARTGDVVLVLADTLRADAVGAFGAAHSQTPFIDELARSAHVLEDATAQAPWTVPSVAALFTALHVSSLDPREEGILRSCGQAGWRLSDGVPTVATRFRDAGFVTAAFQKNPLLAPGTGFERGFAVYEMVGGERAEGEAARQTVDATLRFADLFGRLRRDGDARPVFLYVHFMDPHIGYQPPAPFEPPLAPDHDGAMDGSARAVHRAERRPGGPTPGEVARMRALYGGDVAYFDSQLERLLAGLEAEGLFGADTALVLLADHGEQFGEHGGFEHCDLHVETTRVPVLLRAPGVPPGRSSGPVNLFDVGPTLLELHGLAPLAVAEGRSVLPLLRGLPQPALPAISEHRSWLRVADDDHSYLVLRSDAERLYARRDDPGETRDLTAAAPEVLARMRSLADAHRRRARPVVPPPGAAVVDEETREALRALGYAD